ncbi:putative efflux system component YknX [Rubripirellula tenax]|uniref:Putative efflux system component YknX n=1 Tax=Rubripirellula tenax TaxID=2528015 RepID=A0A5C6EZP9_9BACT|nr:efflux RND transporter periplasmic adaptor subunit [Rubripirellula tenax]TWU54512.1 putative efflux system component YknX [Rubripirellula tenax]
MSQTNTILITLVVCCCGIAIAETQRRNNVATQSDVIKPTPTRFVGQTIRAPGRIKGLTEEIGLRAQILEPIEQVHVRLGDRVKAGDLLVSLDSRSLEFKRDLAVAVLEESQARLSRLRNGARESDLDVARREFDAAVARLESATARLARYKRLFESDAISEQEFEDAKFEFQSLSAVADVAKNQLKSLQDPARAEDIEAAESAVRAARAKLSIAEDQLRRTKIIAPIDGTILKIDARVGELPVETIVEPLIIMCNTQRQRVLAEVDEFDALRVMVGQPCELLAECFEGVIARGTVTEVEPRMDRKKRFGQWAGERLDSFSRRIWVDLDSDSPMMPVGLPVRTIIQIDQPDHETSVEAVINHAEPKPVIGTL